MAMRERGSSVPATTAPPLRCGGEVAHRGSRRVHLTREGKEREKGGGGVELEVRILPLASIFLQFPLPPHVLDSFVPRHLPTTPFQARDEQIEILFRKNAQIDGYILEGELEDFSCAGGRGLTFSLELHPLSMTYLKDTILILRRHANREVEITPWQVK